MRSILLGFDRPSEEHTIADQSVDRTKASGLRLLEAKCLQLVGEAPSDFDGVNFMANSPDVRTLLTPMTPTISPFS